MKEYCSFIDGKYCPPADREVLKRPGTEEPHSVVSRASAPQVLQAASAVVRGFERARSMTAEERKTILQTVSQRVLEASDEFVELLVNSVGKPISMARREVRHCAETLRLSAVEAERIGGEILPMDAGALAARGRMGILRRFPRGPVLAFTPFNFPLNLAAHKIGPAFAVGNSILLKPSTVSAACPLRLAQLFAEAGAPAGTVNVLVARFNQMDPLLFDERFTTISFTGESKRGWGLKAKAGRKRVSLKLGGDSAAIVHSDADLEHVMERCLMGGFAYSGQVCVSLQRLYVHRPLMVSFAERFAERVSQLQEGDPRDEEAVIVPLINENSAVRVESWVHEAVAKGARILCGGARKGSLYPATVLADVDPDCEIARSQVFGPVVILEGYDTFPEAVAKVNNSRYGLQAGVFTRDMERLLYAYENIQAGAVIANDAPTFRDDAMPFGGVKESGLGREGIRSAVEAMTEPRLLVINRLPLAD